MVEVQEESRDLLLSWQQENIYLFSFSIIKTEMIPYLPERMKLINATYFIEHQLSLRPDTGVRIWQDICPVVVIMMVYSTYY